MADTGRLRRLADHPDEVEAALEEWAHERRHALLRTRAARLALQRAALLVREVDGGRTLAQLALRQPPAATYPRWGSVRGARAALADGMLTRQHVVHALRLVRTRARASLRDQDVTLAGMSFLGRRVELTAPRGAGRITVGPWSWIGDDVSLRSHAGRVTLGAKVIVGGRTSVNSYLDVSIGDGALLADVSTSPPALAEEIAGAFEPRLLVADCPLSGGPVGAEAGTLSSMIGGSDEAHARLAPLAETWSGFVVHTGGHGTGQAAKLCNNLLAGTHMAALCLSLQLARRAGLDDTTLFDILSRSTGDSRVMRARYPAPGVDDAHPANRDFEALARVDGRLRLMAVAAAP
jgi:hypothetical protein